MPMMSRMVTTKPTLEATLPNRLANAPPLATTNVTAMARPMDRLVMVPSPMASAFRTVAADSACHRETLAPPTSAMLLLSVPSENSVAGPTSWMAVPTARGTVMRRAIRSPSP